MSNELKNGRRYFAPEINQYIENDCLLLRTGVSSLLPSHEFQVNRPQLEEEPVNEFEDIVNAPLDLLGTKEKRDTTKTCVTLMFWIARQILPEFLGCDRL